MKATQQEKKRLLFTFDTLSVCFGMSRVAAERIQLSLREVEDCAPGDGKREDVLNSAFLDAWSIIDVCHRIRQTLPGIRGLKHSETWRQRFLRATDLTTDLRHYVQHLDEKIPSISPPWTPVMGTLSWVSYKDDQCCLTTMLGSSEEGVNNNSICYDTTRRCFVNRIELTIGNTRVPILHIAERIQQLKDDLIAWVDHREGWTSKRAQTPIYSFRIDADSSGHR